MFPAPLPPLLLADIGDWTWAVILLLSFLGWIVNVIKGNQPDGQPRAPRPKPQRDLRAELDVFLEELQGGKPQPPRPEAVKPPPERPRPVQTAAQASRKKQKAEKKAQNKPAPKPAAKPTAVGGGVREHVAAYMTPDRVGAHAQSHIGQHRIDAAVDQDLAGGTVAPVEAISTPRATPHPLLQVLASRDGLKQAVLMQEIFQRPRVLRRGSEGG